MKALLTTLSFIAFITSSATSVFSYDEEPEFQSESVFLFESDTGRILYEKNPDDQFSIGSLTKIMTLNITGDAIEEGRVQIENKTVISEDSWRLPGSTMFIEVGENRSLEELIKGVTVASGNDASLSIAEKISEKKLDFVDEMNDQAESLNLNDTYFSDPHGLSTDNISSARDIATLSSSYMESHNHIFNDFHSLKSITTETRQDDITQRNRNPIIHSVAGAEGIMTGSQNNYHHISGSVERSGLRLIGVVLGSESARDRETDIHRLFDYGFSQYKSKVFSSENELVDNLPVYHSNTHTNVDIYARDLIEINAHVSDLDAIEVSDSYPDHLSGTFGSGDQIGERVVEYDGISHSSPIIVREDIEKSEGLTRFLDSVALQLSRLFNYLLNFLPF